MKGRRFRRCVRFSEGPYDAPRPDPRSDSAQSAQASAPARLSTRRDPIIGSGRKVAVARLQIDPDDAFDLPLSLRNDRIPGAAGATGGILCS
jgi:hypothetical protein